MSTTLLLAAVAGFGILLMFFGLARTPSSSSAVNVQQRLAAYGGDKPLTVEELELQRPFSERVMRPAIEKLGSLLSRSTPQKARQDLLNRLELAGRPGNLTPEDFAAVRLVAAAVLAAIGLLLGLLMGNVVYLVIALALGISSTSSGGPCAISSWSRRTSRMGDLIFARRAGSSSGRRPTMHAASA